MADRVVVPAARVAMAVPAAARVVLAMARDNVFEVRTSPFLAIYGTRVYSLLVLIVLLLINIL